MYLSYVSEIKLFKVTMNSYLSLLLELFEFFLQATFPASSIVSKVKGSDQLLSSTLREALRF